jgi:hypothetical protein
MVIVEGMGGKLGRSIGHGGQLRIRGRDARP